MSELDPRLSAVLATERGKATVLAVVGCLMVLLGGAFIALGITQQNRDNTIPAVVFGLLFLLPGALMIRTRLRGPRASASVRLLTTERADLTGWDLEYVSVNGGPARPRIVLRKRDGQVVQVSLDEGEEGPVIAFVSELVPRVQRSGA